MALGSGLVVLGILALIAVSTTRQAWPAFQKEGISFVTSSDWSPNQDHYGALAFVFGTALISLVALVLAVPVSIGIALFVNEAGPGRIKKSTTYLIDLLAAIPSVVYGLWGLLVFAPAIQPVYEMIGSTVGRLPALNALFGGQASGKSYLTAALILAFMITPIITSISREVINTVPAHQREAALALGATRWESIRSAVLPWARGGIVGGVMLGLGRAMGETIASALVIGASPQITLRLFAPGDAMAGRRRGVRVVGFGGVVVLGSGLVLWRWRV